MKIWRRSLAKSLKILEGAKLALETLVDLFRPAIIPLLWLEKLDGVYLRRTANIALISSQG